MAVTTTRTAEPAVRGETDSAASKQAIREVSNVFKLLSDETRLRILAYLAEQGEVRVMDLCERLGQNQPAVSHNLALLRVSGLIEPRREGKHIFYQRSDKELETRELLT